MLKIFKVLIFIIASSFSLSAVGQTIEGLVKGEDTQLPIQYAIVSVINEDDLIVGGAVTDTLGYFKIDEIIEGRYKMTVEYTGYRTKIIEVDMDSEHFDFDPIFLIREEEIVVKSQTVSKSRK